ncbi:hydroxyisourate hydrolase [Neobacillus ginsengisoli]|uniref:hydroxyisourate hydrolase n=1 Tax=Neobacillus ginsengisoli TaxID=904295 RepID=UPI0027D7D557|nr:hydroxyisourate hydrolase [Neobacillus ginsengisoli]
MNGLTTHVLDLAHGKPAANIKIELYRLNNGTRNLLKEAMTNADGRIDQPLLLVDQMVSGEYELLFYVGDYFHQKGLPLQDPPFLNKVSVRIGLADSSLHYHVPLLVSPWGYQVYRGS